MKTKKIKNLFKYEIRRNYEEETIELFITDIYNNNIKVFFYDNWLSQDFISKKDWNEHKKWINKLWNSEDTFLTLRQLNNIMNNFGMYDLSCWSPLGDESLYNNSGY